MLMSMINLDRLQQTILLVVIQRDNLDRMKKADPITLESTLAGGLLPPPRYPLNLSILMAYEDDQDEVYRRARGDQMEFLKWLERGRVFIKGVDGKSEAFRVPRKEATDDTGTKDEAIRQPTE